MIIPASAASIAPRSDVSSQGCTTIVVAAGNLLRLAISRSYFDSADGGHWQPVREPCADLALLAQARGLSISSGFASFHRSLAGCDRE